VQALAGIECIEGSVQLHGSAGSLQPLVSLRRISGVLSLSGKGFSEGLLGLETLEFIGAGIGMHETDMIDLSGLEGLKESGPLDFYLNFQLVSLDGLNGLQHIDGGLYLGSDLKGSNTNLASIAALAALEDISGDLEISGSGLDSLAGLEQLKSVGGYVHIRGNKKLPTCQAVAFVESVDIMGSVEIFSNLKDRCGG
jgi:hypothetical protein